MAPKTQRGLSTHPLYRVWVDMKRRCYAKHRKEKYAMYGGRGIRVCTQWKDNFLAFYDWAIENGWKRGLQVDRRNNDGNYSPSNCRVVTGIVNQNNKRTSYRLCIFGETKTAKEWSRDPRCSVKFITFWKRLTKYGWRPEVALTRVARNWKRKSS